MPGHPLLYALCALVIGLLPLHIALAAERNIEQGTTSLARANEQIWMPGIDPLGDSVSANFGTLSCRQTDLLFLGKADDNVSATNYRPSVTQPLTLPVRSRGIAHY
jgi:hypothetical protein